MKPILKREIKTNFRIPITPVHQFMLDGTWIATYESIMEASRQTGVNNGNILKCCREERTHAGNYIWEFTD